MINNRSRNIAIAAFLIPGLLYYSLLVLSSVTQGLVLSTFRWVSLEKRVFVGFDNYFSVFRDGIFWKSLRISLVFMVITTALQVVLGFLLGYFLYLQLRGYRFFKVVFFIPVVLNTVAVGFIWSYIYSPAFGLLKPCMEVLHQILGLRLYGRTAPGTEAVQGLFNGKSLYERPRRLVLRHLHLLRRAQERQGERQGLRHRHGRVTRALSGAGGTFRFPWRLGYDTGELALFCFEKGTPVSSILGLAPDTRFRLSWFDPRKGTWTEAADLGTDGEGKMNLPDKPTDDDWSLRIKAIL